MLSQAARTYLERKFETFPNESVDALINHGLQALSASLQEGELTKQNCTVGVVGLDMAFSLLEGDDLVPYLTALKDEGNPTVNYVLINASPKASILPRCLCCSADGQGGADGVNGADGDASAPMES